MKQKDIYICWRAESESPAHFYIASGVYRFVYKDAREFLDMLDGLKELVLQEAERNKNHRINFITAYPVSMMEI